MPSAVMTAGLSGADFLSSVSSLFALPKLLSAASREMTSSFAA